MNWFKKHKLLFAGIVAISIILCIAYFSGAKPPKEAEIQAGSVSETPQIAEFENKLTPEELPEEESKEQDADTSKKEAEAKKMEETEQKKEEAPNQQSSATSESVPPEESPVSSDAPKEVPSSDKLTCRLSVRCDTILNNMDKVKEEKKKIIPKDGIIYSEKEVEFFENETAFNVLLREMKQNRIHFEFEKTPAYNSMYVEGIGNIYEFDAGELSGWLYKVNGKFLSHSLSEQKVKNGDIIEIIYTCNLGNDLK